MNQYKLIIPENLDGVRLDKALSLLCDLTRTRIQQLIKSGNIQVNGCIADSVSSLVKAFVEIEVSVPPPIDTTMREADIPLDIMYEDDDLLVINKQSGLTVHPGAGQHSDTLANALLKHCKDSLSGIGGVTRPGIVHRLDRDTSGLMMVAKNDYTHIALSAQIASRDLKRVYNALLWGVPIPHSGTISTLIDRSHHDRTRMQVVKSGGKEASTHYRILEIYANASLVECRLETGRTHQIRVHMSHIGHSVIGDQSYGHNARKVQKYYKGEPLEEFKRQALHSCFIEFVHPRTEEVMQFTAAMPDDMAKIQQILRG
ncbi:MAG: RluA family pseudouridine synthase [Pseudomonadota bacterium]